MKPFSLIENPFAPEKQRSTDDPKFVGKILGPEAEAAMRRVAGVSGEKRAGSDDFYVTPEEQAKSAEEKEARERARKEFVRPLEDKDVPKEYKETLMHWRELAKELNYDGPVIFRIKAGFTLKEHASKAGPCHDDFEYIQNLELENDKPTENSLVFWIPRFVSGSMAQPEERQHTLLDDIRTRFHLPEHHCSSFGGASLLVALILDHFRRTGEQVPLDGGYVRTDTRIVGIARLNLDWHEDYLYGDSSCSRHGGGVVVFPLGVEVLKKFTA